VGGQGEALLHAVELCQHLGVGGGGCGGGGGVAGFRVP
jgi:hypothetical protein